MPPTHEANPQENANTEAKKTNTLNKAALQLPQNHTHAQIRPKKSAAHLQNTPFWGTTFGGLLLQVKRILKGLNYEKFLLTVVKRNLLAIKMDK